MQVILYAAAMLGRLPVRRQHERRIPLTTQGAAQIGERTAYAALRCSGLHRRAFADCKSGLGRKAGAGRPPTHKVACDDELKIKEAAHLLRRPALGGCGARQHQDGCNRPKRAQSVPIPCLSRAHPVPKACPRHPNHAVVRAQGFIQHGETSHRSPRTNHLPKPPALGTGADAAGCACAARRTGVGQA